MEKLITLAALFFTSSGGTILREGRHFTAFFSLVDSNARITSNCLKNITSGCSLRKCVAECVALPQCKTFNHQKRDGICELLSISKFDDVGLLRKHVYWTHYEADDDADNVGPICQSITPCKHFEVCEDTYKEHPRFRCRCRDGFSEEKCHTYSGPGADKNTPAPSCRLLLTKFKSIHDGHYWIKGQKNQTLCKKSKEKRRNTTKLPQVSTPAPQAVREKKCQNKSTALADAGQGKTYYLDRHNMTCGTNVLSRMKLWSSGSHIKYDYECCEYVGTCVYEERTTNARYADKGQPRFLDRHEITCAPTGSFGFLSEVRLINGGNKRVYYKYKCCKVTEQKNCYDDETAVKDEPATTDSLTSHNVRCKPHYGLVHFRLTRNNAERKKFQYNYKCCRLTGFP